ncbi:MAG: nitroreductase family protein [Methanobacteriaceae archaeon]
MEFIDVIKNRYSVRGYKSDKIEKEKLDMVLEAATIAPTGVNAQGFKVFVIDTKINKEALKEVYSRDWLVEAPLVLAVVAIPEKCWTRSWDKWSVAEVDATIVMDHMILQATDLGLGTCWIAAFKRDALSKMLNLDESHVPVVLTPLGYPNDDGLDKPRKSIDELVIYK